MRPDLPRQRGGSIRGTADSARCGEPRFPPSRKPTPADRFEVTSQNVPRDRSSDLARNKSRIGLSQRDLRPITSKDKLPIMHFDTDFDPEFDLLRSSTVLGGSQCCYTERCNVALCGPVGVFDDSSSATQGHLGRSCSYAPRPAGSGRGRGTPNLPTNLWA